MPRLLPAPAYFASLPKVISSAAVILRDETGRVLIEDPNYKPHWLLPGGSVDPGEDPRQTAEREVLEELGLTVQVGQLLTVDWKGSDAMRSSPMGVHFLFDAGVIPAAELEASVVVQQEELDGWRLVPEAELGMLGQWNAARARRALAVLHGTASVDLVAE